MQYRFRKQIFIIFVLLVFIALISAGVYFQFIKKAPTCFDNIKNQNEEDVDCGGPCVSCERRTIKDVEIDWTSFVLLKDNRYDAAAKITNPNPNFGLAQINYTFEFYGGNSELLKEQKGRSYLLPNEIKYLIEANVSVGQPVAQTRLKIETPDKSQWQKVRPEYTPPRLFVQNRTFKFLENQPSVAEVSGVIKNDSDFDLESVDVSVVLFDADKKVIGLNKTSAKTVLAGEERYFSVLWFDPLPSTIKSFDILLETNLFSDENFMRQFGSYGDIQRSQPTPSGL